MEDETTAMAAATEEAEVGISTSASVVVVSLQLLSTKCNIILAANSIAVQRTMISITKVIATREDEPIKHHRVHVSEKAYSKWVKPMRLHFKCLTKSL